MNDTRTIYDAIIVGSGATGGWAAYELTARGFKVLLLEAGRELQRERDFPAVAPRGFLGPVDRLKARLLEGQWRQASSGLYFRHTRHFYVDDRAEPYTTPFGRPYLWVRGKQLGGRLHTWGRVAPRFGDEQFKAASRDGFGVDWPLDYRELAPYYDRVERFFGLQGRPAPVHDGCFSREGSFNAGEARLEAAVSSAMPECRVLVPSMLLTASGPEPAPIAAARTTGRLTVRSNAIATRVTVERASSSANGVVTIDRASRQLHQWRGRVVLLCASTIESIRLLLNSATAQHPGGLGSSSGLLGRCLMDHAMVAIGGIATHVVSGPEASAAAREDPYDLGAAVGLHVPRFRNVGGRREPYLRGFCIMGGVGRPSWFRPSWLRRRDAPFYLEAFGEVLPRPENRVTLDPSKVDAWDIPVPRIEYRHGENERAMMADAAACLVAMARAAGFLRLLGPRRAVPGGAVHDLGGARMGEDPRLSVLDRYNQCWDVKNLYVTDGSCFPTSGHQNPTLTMMALTARACDHIGQRVKDGSL